MKLVHLVILSSFSDLREVLTEKHSYSCGRRWPGCHCEDRADAIGQIDHLQEDDLDVRVVVAAMEQAEIEEAVVMEAGWQTAS